ncbi:retrotransposon protein, putative, ty1-copia subclass [Tanacetum coccineum]
MILREISFFLKKLFEDKPSEAKKLEIDPLIREQSDTFLMGDTEIKLNPLMDIDDPIPIPSVSEKPLDSLDPILETFDMTITNTLFDFDSEFTLNSDYPVFDIQNEESDESETETIIEELQIHSSQSDAMWQLDLARDQTRTVDPLTCHVDTMWLLRRLTNKEATRGQNDKNGSCQAMDPDASRRAAVIGISCGVGRGVKEKNINRNMTNTTPGGVTPSVVDMMVEKEKISSLDDTTILESFPTLTTSVTTTAGNALGKSSYANITGKPSGKKVNVRTLFTPGGNGIDVVVPVDSIRAISERFANNAYGFFLGKKVAYPVVANYVRNTWSKYGLVRLMFSSSTRLFSFQFSSMDGLDVMLENDPWFIQNNLLILKKWHPDENLLKEDVSTILVWVKLHGVPVMAFSEDGLSAIATKLGTPIMLDSYTSDMCMQSWRRLSYARVMIKLRADMELKDNIVVAMPKITRDGHYTCNVCVEYKWKPPRCSSCKVFGHSHEECPKNICAGEKKTVKKPSQTSRGVPVGPKMGFKPHKEYRPVPKKSTASSSGNKKKGEEPTIEVSNSNPFDVLNSVDNDVEFGTNGGTTNLVNNGATSSGSSCMNVDNSSSGTTPIIEKIGKFEDLITSGQAILVDKDGNLLKKVEFPGEYDSEDEVASVDNDMARFMAYERGFGTQSLLEQWSDSYDNGDYDDDPYDDDMYEGQDLSHELQAICDNLDIRVRGRKKK